MSKMEEKPKRTSLRDRVLQNISAEGFEEAERDIPVVARMNKRAVEILDSLVAIGVFKSRSEAAAALIEGAISSREDMFNDIKRQAANLNQQQDAAMKEAQEAILGKMK
jgi:Arc/MetJ-type ribon-helix-helix transcriptional regulator